MAISVTWGPRALLAACVLLAAISASSQQKRAIDCRRFVFAPICRGVAAKRTDPAVGFGMTRFLHAMQQQQRFPVESEAADLGLTATSSPAVRELPLPVSQRRNNEQDLTANERGGGGGSDSMYHAAYLMPRFPAPRPEYEY